MKRKRSILGVVVWLFFTITIVGAMGQTLYTMTTIIPKSSWIMEGLILGCVVAATICVLIAIRVMALQVQSKFGMTRKKAMILEVLAVIIVISVMILIRLYYIEELDMNGAENIFFQLASVETNKLSFTTTNHATIIYVYILSFLLALLGNKIIIGIYFQLALQCITLLLAYLTIRNISGKMTALIANLILSILTVYLNTLLPLAPENLLLCIFMLGFWMISLLWKHMNANQDTKVLDVILFFMAGVATAAIIYTDIIGLFLFVISIGGIAVSNRNTARTPLLQTVCYIIGSVVGVIFFFQIEAIICKVSFLQIANQYLNPWMTVAIHNVSIFPSEILEVSIVMVLITGVWCVRYWQTGCYENTIYSILLISSVSIRVLFHTELDYSLLLIFSWIFAAAASLKSLCCKYEEELVEEPGVILLSNLIKDVPVNPAGDGVEMNIMKKSKQLNESKVNLNLIPNPLPLPKQHERKEMDYAFIPEEDKMHYDIDVVEENDDFDVS